MKGEEWRHDRYDWKMRATNGIWDKPSELERYEWKEKYCWQLRGVVRTLKV